LPFFSQASLLFVLSRSRTVCTLPPCGKSASPGRKIAASESKNCADWLASLFLPSFVAFCPQSVTYRLYAPSLRKKRLAWKENCCVRIEKLCRMAGFSFSFMFRCFLSSICHVPVCRLPFRFPLSSCGFGEIGVARNLNTMPRRALILIM